MCLLICDEAEQPAVEADLLAELDVQLGIELRVVKASRLHDADQALGLDTPGPVHVLHIDRWSPRLVNALDLHIVRLERTGAQFLFLASPELAERLLKHAPNFRNRLTDIARIVPDNPYGD
ncbi:MAG TPA: hypothetical protein VE959_16375 [Bryobacteraceae bacterium]|nr:hypothetical protein [Bryobacteraceae bacterium]